ncbi:hypothetical protein [Pseudonocardia spinosispora]|uniref:hypothetical protein n=1 Tax=Pseudonocardia spinosispora TaxID=103441 RepID=UPI00048D6FA3|nr:hypothetical protein [Pseudonocardia spinosispora]
MSWTTIKVDTVVRDRLAGIARQRGVTMGELLDTASLRLADEQRWAQIEDAYQRMQREDPDGWHDYLGELASVTTGESDATAAEEWPEHNK